MGNYFLSVIIPVFNCKAYLPECINSFLAAGHKKIQLILVDDGSTDGSGCLCENFSAQNDCVEVYHIENRGPSFARNLGIEKSEGEFITFADGDDYIDPVAFLRTFYELSEEKDPKSDIWAADFYRVAYNGTILDKLNQITDGPPFKNQLYKDEFLKTHDCNWNVWRYIYKRDYLIRTGLRFTEGINCGEDLEFSSLALSLTDNITYYHNPYYFYRVNHSNTLMHNYSAKRVSDLMHSLRSVYSVIKNNDAPWIHSLLHKISREYILNITLYAEGSKEEKKEICKLFKDNIFLLDDAKGIYAVMAFFVRLLGVRISSYLILFPKIIKRSLREKKSK